MRYQCDIEGLEHCFVEFSDRWSRKEVREWFAAVEMDALCAIYQRKIMSCALDCTDTDPITDPKQLTPEGLDRMDFRLFRWFSALATKHTNELFSLGEASRRRLFAIAEASEAISQPN